MRFFYVGIFVCAYALKPKPHDSEQDLDSLALDPPRTRIGLSQLSRIERDQMAQMSPVWDVKQSSHAINPECYVVTKRLFNKGILDSSIDATFIITTTGSNRMQEAQEQLEFLVPTRDVYTVYNRPSPDCAKELLGQKVDTTYQDLTHAYLYVIQHAAELNYQGRILILEDDFVWHPRLAKPAIQDDLQTFLTENNPRLYALGAVWGWAFPTYSGSMKHIWINERAGSHALIISNETRLDLLSMKWQYQRKWDIDMILTSFGGMYMYWQPLCVQCFTHTENSKTYEKEVPFARQILVEVGLRFYTMLGIDSHCREDLASKWDHVYWTLFALHVSGYVVFFGLFAFVLFYVAERWSQKFIELKEAKENKGSCDAHKPGMDLAAQPISHNPEHSHKPE